MTLRINLEQTLKAQRMEHEYINTSSDNVYTTTFEDNVVLKLIQTQVCLLAKHFYCKVKLVHSGLGTDVITASLTSPTPSHTHHALSISSIIIQVQYICLNFNIYITLQSPFPPVHLNTKLQPYLSLIHI